MVKGQGNTSQSALRTQSWGIHFLQEILLKVQMSLNMPWNLNVSAVKVKYTKHDRLGFIPEYKVCTTYKNHK